MSLCLGHIIVGRIYTFYTKLRPKHTNQRIQVCLSSRAYMLRKGLCTRNRLIMRGKTQHGPVIPAAGTGMGMVQVTRKKMHRSGWAASTEEVGDQVLPFPSSHVLIFSLHFAATQFPCSSTSQASLLSRKMRRNHRYLGSCPRC